MNRQEIINAIKNDLYWHNDELKEDYKVVLESAIEQLEKIDKIKEKTHSLQRVLGNNVGLPAIACMNELNILLEDM